MEVEGVAFHPLRGRSPVALLPWPASGGRRVLFQVSAFGAELTGGGEAAAKAEGEASARQGPAPRGSSSLQEELPGWARLRKVSVARALAPGTVWEGEGLRDLLREGVLETVADLQWAASGTEGLRAAVLEERSMIEGYEVDISQVVCGSRPCFRSVTQGILASPDGEGGTAVTGSTLLPPEEFTTSFGNGSTTLHLPQLRVQGGTLPSSPGERLLVLGPREDGGVDGVLLSFRPGAEGPE